MVEGTASATLRRNGPVRENARRTSGERAVGTVGSGETGQGEAGDPATVNDANTVPVATTGNDGVAAADQGATPTTMLKASATKAPVPAAELLRGNAGDIQATTVSMERSGAERITAERAVMDRSGARTLDARSAQLDRSGVVTLKSERAVIQDGSAMVVTAGEVRLVKSKVAVAAGPLTADGETRILFHVGPVTGGARPLVDASSVAGWVAAAVAAVLLLANRRRGR